MNEQVEALIARARNRALYLYSVADRQGDYEALYNRTLIELTVQECVNAIIDDSRLNDVRSAANGCVGVIYEHFGVEE